MLALASPGQAATNDFFARGMAAAKAGDFAAAAADFQSAVQREPSAGALVNLGLAEWRRGRAGAAILAWERARWLDPFDPRAAQNLKFARQVAQVDEPRLKWYEAVSAWLPPGAWLWLAGASLWVTLGAALAPAIFRRRKSGGGQTLAALALGFFLFSLMANWGAASRTMTGFVVRKNAALRLTPTATGEVVMTLNAGEPGRQLRRRGDFRLIDTGSGRGWVAAEDFGRLVSDGR